MMHWFWYTLELPNKLERYFHAVLIRDDRLNFGYLNLVLDRFVLIVAKRLFEMESVDATFDTIDGITHHYLS